MGDYDLSMSGLNTPIKKIRNLTLASPGSPVRYPSMSDFPVADPIFLSMVDRGYSQTLSNKVLQELDCRANEISTKLASHAPKVTVAKKKRYSGVHRPLFSKMESISTHYAAARLDDSSPAREFALSATKKRRTLNGPEELFGGLDKENDSPIRRKVPALGAVLLTPLTTSFGSPTLAPAPLLSPFRADSPTRIPVLAPSAMESPTRFTRISPSRGSVNLNKMLNDDDDDFVKPLPRVRQSSLQRAGVQPVLGTPLIYGLNGRSGTPNLQKKSSIPSLQKKPSVPSLQTKASFSNLQNRPLLKPSTATLQKKPSIPTLQKKPSIPTIQKKPSIPTLQKKPLVPTLQKRPSTASLNHFAKPAVPTLHKKPSTSSISSVRTTTVPKPFSLYDRPTISSTQKSFGTLTASASNLSNMEKSSSMRSLSKFQKFKSRFS